MEGSTTKSRVRLLAVVVAALILGTIIGVALGPALVPAGRATEQRPTVEVPIGALLPLTGDLASFGKREQRAIEMAVQDVNKFAESIGAPFRFKLIVEDTRDDPETARSRIQVLAAQGVRAIVGPLSSGETAAVKQFADANKIVIVSHGSTAVSLAIPGDYVFRLTPTDKYQGRVLARVIWQQGYRNVAVIYRNDAWGQGLYESLKTSFEALGGRVDGVAYDPRAQDLSGEVSRLADIVSRFGDNTAVVMMSFEDDGINIIRLSARNPVLSSKVFFGTDGSALSSRFLTEVGEEILKLGGNPSTNYWPASNPMQQEFVRRYRDLYGENPDAYSMNAYDAVWLIALSVMLTGRYDGEAIARAIPLVAQHYYGVTGNVILDENGDRAYGDYGVFKVEKTPQGLDWVLVAIYDVTQDRLVPASG